MQHTSAVDTPRISGHGFVTLFLHQWCRTVVDMLPVHLYQSPILKMATERVAGISLCGMLHRNSMTDNLPELEINQALGKSQWHRPWAVRLYM